MHCYEASLVPDLGRPRLNQPPEKLAHPWDLGLGLGGVFHLLAGLGVLRLRVGAGLPCKIDSNSITIIGRYAGWSPHIYVQK